MDDLFLETMEEVLSRLSIFKEEIEGDASYYLMWDDQSQIATEDDRVFDMDFSNNQLEENCELEEDVVQALQQHQEAIIKWVEAQGFEVKKDDKSHEWDE